jgi:hypothetical protein
MGAFHTRRPCAIASFRGLGEMKPEPRYGAAIENRSKESNKGGPRGCLGG